MAWDARSAELRSTSSEKRLRHCCYKSTLNDTKTAFKKISERYERGLILNSAILSNEYEHVFSGFFIEKTRSSIYIYRFTFPLFNNSKAFHLLFSERIASVALIKNIHHKKCEEEVFIEVLGTIEKNKEILSRSVDLEKFCSYIRSLPGVLENGHGMFIYALANCLLGKFEVTEQYLRLALPRLQDSKVEVCERALQLLL